MFILFVAHAHTLRTLMHIIFYIFIDVSVCISSYKCTCYIEKYLHLNESDQDE